ncbi:sucrose-6-phosphate hydrolase [Marinilactibacillus sp. 15R]|uniref:glycoside hydrolase family 32 protein n=1 Tax=Marinilactibacillus sp. 15R TaxID=1911586 RepID=UPI00090A635C|nr:sucrose-6-phosphate hydrolase [Marinilactibacillus sp. 15R]API88703.1 sucrose-6-phosphate hydrolase [Marinilactibacillus sp. 15R]
MNLIREELQKGIRARQKELLKQVEIDPWRLKYHQQAPTGWLNDPNGVHQKDGIYHLYYQYSPLEASGGLKYWGHKTSKDLVYFKEEEVFLFPDQKFDCHGVYSGSAFERNGLIHFFYTGNVKHIGKEHDYIVSGREQNTVHMTSKDGFAIDTREVVIDANEYPEGFTQHIRDPKIIEKDDLFYMVLGGRTSQDKGAILLYESENLNDWNYKGNLLDNQSGLGYMWECPDFFTLNGQDILLMSPQGVLREGYKFENVYQSGFLIGETDWSTLKFLPNTDFEELDRGFDFYAPQTFEDEKGRRILWGWMGLPDIEPEYSNPTIERGWQHAMTMPRELTIENSKLKQRPLEEYRVLRKNEWSQRVDLIETNYTVSETSDAYEMIVDIEKPTEPLKIFLSQDVKITFNGNLFTLELGESGYGRKTRSIELSTLTSIQLFVDSSSLEIFINDGEFVMTTRIYPNSNLREIQFEGRSRIQVKKWDLNAAQ